MPIRALLKNMTAGAALPRSTVRVRASHNPVSASTVKLTPNALKRMKKSELVELGSQFGLSPDEAAKQVKQQLVNFIVASISSSDEDMELPQLQAAAVRIVDISAVRSVEDVPQSMEEALQLPMALLVDLAVKDLGFPSSVVSAMDKEEVIMRLWLGKPFQPKQTYASSAAGPVDDVPQYKKDAMKLEAAMKMDSAQVDAVLNLKPGQDIPPTMDDAMRVPTAQLVELAKTRLGYPAAAAQKMEKEDLIVTLWLAKPYKGGTKQAQPKSNAAPAAAPPAAAAPAPRAKAAPAKRAHFSIPESLDAAMQLPKAQLVELATEHLGYQRKAAEGMDKEDLIMKLWLAQPSLSSSDYDYTFDINNLEDVERPSTAHSDTPAQRQTPAQPLYTIPQSMEAALQVPTSELVDLGVEHLGYPRTFIEGLEKEDLIMKLWLAQPSLSSSDYDYDFDINNLEDVERPSTAHAATAEQAESAPRQRASFSIPQSMDAALEMPTSELVDLGVEHLGYPRTFVEGMEKEDLIMKLWLAQPSLSSSDYDYDFDINNLEDVERLSTSSFEDISDSAAASIARLERLEDVPQTMEAAMEVPLSQLVDVAAEHLGYPRMFSEGMEKEELITRLWVALE